MKNLKFLYLIIVCLMVFISSAFAVQQPGYFKLDSYKQILQENKQRPFLMVLWSLDCAPCIKELKILAEFHQEYPQHKIIMISTDDKNQSDEITLLITQYGLQTVDQWVFDGSFQYLRYSIDPTWYGELPRSYFFEQDQSRLASSGQLHQNQLGRYFAQNIKKSGSKTL